VPPRASRPYLGGPASPSRAPLPRARRHAPHARAAQRRSPHAVGVSGTPVSPPAAKCLGLPHASAQATALFLLRTHYCRSPLRAPYCADMASRLYLLRQTTRALRRQTPRSRPFPPWSDGGNVASSRGMLELLAPPLSSPSAGRRRRRGDGAPLFAAREIQRRKKERYHFAVRTLSFE
jgi:hypothetical protein